MPKRKKDNGTAERRRFPSLFHFVSRDTSSKSQRDQIRLRFIYVPSFFRALFFFTFLITLCQTNLNGLPTISALLAHTPVLVAFAAVFICLIIMAFTCLTFFLTGTVHPVPHTTEPECSDHLITIGVVLSYIFHAVQFVGFMLILVIPETTYPNQHVAITVTTFSICVLLSMIDLMVRWLKHGLFYENWGKCKIQPMKKLFGYTDKCILRINLFFVIYQITLAMMFGVFMVVRYEPESWSAIAITEYLLLDSVIFMETFRMLDVYICPKIDPLLRTNIEDTT